MANYSELLNDINAAIYENNDQEIDALEVRAILREMVTSLGSGFLFKGIATPSSPSGTGTYEPDQNVFYLATTAGTYTYLGGLVVAAGEVAFLCFDGTWTKKSSALLSTGSIVDNTTTEDATKPLSAKQGKVLADAGAATAAEVTALGQEVDEVELAADGLLADIDTSKSGALFGYQTEKKTNLAGGAYYVAGVPLKHTCKIKKLRFDASITAASITMGYCFIEKGESNATVNYKIIETANITTDGDYKAANFSDLVIPKGAYLFGMNQIFGGKFINLFPDFTQSAIAASSTIPTEGSFTTTNGASLMIGFDIIGEIVVNVADGLKEVSDYSLHNDSAINTEMFGFFTQKATPSAGGNNTFYVFAGKAQKDIRVEKLRFDPNFAATDVTLGYCFITEGVSNLSIDYTFFGKAAVVSENGYKYAYFPGMVIPKGAYIIGNKLSYLYNTEKVFPSLGNNLVTVTLSPPTSLVPPTGTFTSANGILLTIGFDIIGEVINEKAAPDISVLFLGNSLAQDAIQYVPWILCNIAPELHYKIVSWYYGSATLAMQLDKLNNTSSANPPYVYLSTSNGMKWVAKSSEWASLFAEGFSHIAIQEYSNGVTTFDKSTYIAVIERLRELVGSNPKFYHILDKTTNGDTALAARARLFAKTAYEQTPISGIVNPGTAFELAYADPELYAVITSDSGYTDTLHAQEGVPCLIEAYNVALWILKESGRLNDSILSQNLYLDALQYGRIGVNGPNGDPIYSTQAIQRKCQEMARVAFNKIDAIKLGLMV